MNWLQHTRDSRTKFRSGSANAWLLTQAGVPLLWSVCVFSIIQLCTQWNETALLVYGLNRLLFYCWRACIARCWLKLLVSVDLHKTGLVVDWMFLGGMSCGLFHFSSILHRNCFLLLFSLPFFTLLFLPYSLGAAMRVLITLLLCVQYIYIAFRHYATAVLFCWLFCSGVCVWERERERESIFLFCCC